MSRLKSAGGVYDIDVHTHHRPELVLGGVWASPGF